jgi:hypothetical protein
MPLPSVQPLQRLLPLPTSSKPQSNKDVVGDGNGSDGYSNKGNGQAMERMAMTTATTSAMAMTRRWQATKRAMARAARAMTTATKRAMVMAARVMVMATKRAMATNGEGKQG